MYRYTISFTTESLDETSLRDVLEEQFRVYDCSVSRSKVGVATAPPESLTPLSPSKKAASEHLAKLMSFFETGELVTPKTIRKGLPGLNNSSLQKDLLKLCAAGQLRKVSHGLYQSTRFPQPTDEEVDAIRNSRKVRVTGTEDERLIEYLKEPREGTDLRFFLKVSRQRVDQKIKLLMDKGIVFREKIDGKRFLYCSDNPKLMLEIDERRKHPSHAAKRVISVLPEGPCLVSEIATICGLGSAPTNDAVRELEERNLVESFRVGGARAVQITVHGLASEYVSDDDTKAPISDLANALGDSRADVLELLAVLGEATSRELTMALRGLYPEKGEPRMGQRIQRIRGEGLIVSIKTANGKQPAHRLSAIGEVVWNQIKDFRNPLTHETVLHHIRTGTAEYAARMGGAAEWKPQGRSLSMMRSMGIMGELTQRELVELMEDPFENPRSADLALRNLRERGMVERTGAGTSGEPYRWKLTEEGRNATDAAQNSFPA